MKPSGRRRRRSSMNQSMCLQSVHRQTNSCLFEHNISVRVCASFSGDSIMSASQADGRSVGRSTDKLMHVAAATNMIRVFQTRHTAVTPSSSYTERLTYWFFMPPAIVMSTTGEHKLNSYSGPANYHSFVLSTARAPQTMNASAWRN